MKNTQRADGKLSQGRYEDVASFVNMRFVPFGAAKATYVNHLDRSCTGEPGCRAPQPRSWLKRANRGQSRNKKERRFVSLGEVRRLPGKKIQTDAEIDYPGSTGRVTRPHPKVFCITELIAIPAEVRRI